MSTVILDNIHVDIPYQRILNRLGYRKKTTLSFDQKNKLDNLIALSSVYCRLKGSYKKLQITENIENTILVENGSQFISEKLAAFLNTSSEIFMIGVTAGKEIMNYRDSFIEKEDLYSSVIVDAVGSEMVESAANWIHDLLKKLIMKNGCELTKNRFSPGYGDLKLSYQEDFYRILELDKIGVKLSKEYFLIPEKSITAVIGVL